MLDDLYVREFYGQANARPSEVKKSFNIGGSLMTFTETPRDNSDEALLAANRVVLALAGEAVLKARSAAASPAPETAT
jgi:hypothetical protein